MYDPLRNFLAKRPFIVLDGALATELERRGMDLNDPLWSAKCLIERPELIRAVHLDYFRAGADIATTATYQATFEAFGRRGLTREAAAQLMQGAVALAAAARDEFWAAESNRPGRLRPLVAASIGPYGAMLADGSEYRGRYALDTQALADFHEPRLRTLAEAGADLLAFETIPCLREAMVLARLLQDFPDLTAWLSFSCRGRGTQLRRRRPGGLRRGARGLRSDRGRGRQLHAAAVHDAAAAANAAGVPPSRSWSIPIPARATMPRRSDGRVAAARCRWAHTSACGEPKGHA